MKKDSENSTGFLLPWLIFLTGIFLISLLLSTDSGGVLQEKLSFFKCLYQQVMGHGGPLCGMTRAFVHAGHLDFRDSFYMNPAGTLLYIYMVIYIATGWFYMFFRIESLKRFLEFNTMVPISSTVMGSWILILLFR
jgi:hypothetical protein